MSSVLLKKLTKTLRTGIHYVHVTKGKKDLEGEVPVVQKTQLANQVVPLDSGTRHDSNTRGTPSTAPQAMHGCETLYFIQCK